MPKILTRLRIDEVSSVDRGAGEGVKIMLMKRNEDKPMSTKIGQMFSNLFSGGNSNNVTIDKAIEGLAESVGTIVNEATNPTELTTSLTKTFEQFGDHLKSSLTAGPAVIEKKEPEMDLKALAKALGLAETATEAEINTAVTKNISDQRALAASFKKMEKEARVLKADFTADELAFWKASQYDSEENDEEGDGDPKGKGKPAKKFLEASHSERAAIMKAAEPPVPPHIQKLMDDNAKMAKQLAELQAGGNLAKFQKRAVELNLPETEAITLQKAYSGDPEAIEKLENHMKTLVATAKAGGVFKEFGANGGTGVVTTAYDEIVALAKNLQKTDPKLDFSRAFAKVYEDPANIEIVKRERGENRPAVA
jgi:hypothetical protein